MDTAVRILIGGVIGLVGGLLYVFMKYQITESKKLSWEDTITCVLLATGGLVLVGVADWILAPITFSAMSRRTMIALLFVAAIPCYVAMRRAIKQGLDDTTIILLYGAALFFPLVGFKFLLIEFDF